MQLIYQTQQIRELENLAQQQCHLTEKIMMQRAAEAAFDFLKKRWPEAKKIMVVCGTGNNGGDGYRLAYYAHEQGLQVSIVQVGDIKKIKAEAKAAYDDCHKAGLLHVDQTDTDLIVDAICGIGLREPLRADVVRAIKKMHAISLSAGRFATSSGRTVPILSLDVPTGVDADTGNILGCAVQATATITFIGLKLGLLTGAGVSYTGEVICDDLQFPEELFSQVKAVATKINFHDEFSCLKPRLRDWHKGKSGHVLIVGGEYGYSGAPRMAAEAALRVGAGLVSVATRLEHAEVMNLTCPEIMCHDVSHLAGLIEKATVIVIGPGLGMTDWSLSLFNKVRKQSCPLVIDADGLNLLAKHHDHSDHWILTPHVGEAARLLDMTTQQIQQNRLRVAQSIQKQYGGVCVLKGAGSLVVCNQAISVCDKGNPGMATAGMGDILSGVIGGLLAQRVPMHDAAKLGVVMHAMAGDLAAREGERGMKATDLLPYLRQLSNVSTT